MRFLIIKVIPINIMLFVDSETEELWINYFECEVIQAYWPIVITFIILNCFILKVTI